MGLLSTRNIDGFGNKLRLYADETGTSTANNTSSVHAYLELYVVGSVASANINVAVSGTGNQSLGYRSYSSGTHRLVDGYFTVNHNADGQGSANVSGYFHSSIGNWDLSGTLPLTRIPRQANITSAPNFNDEDNPTITYSNSAGNNVSSLQASIQSVTGTVFASYRDINKVGNSYTFELTNAEREALLNATPNSNSLAVRFILKTVISEFTFEDTNVNTLALTGNNKYNINGYSNIRFTIPTINKAEAIKSATMSKYKFFIGTQSIEKTYSNSEDITTILVGATSGTYNVYAIDSRNNSTLVTKFADREIDYEKPYIDKQSTSVSRNNNQVGTSVNLVFNGTYWNNNFGVADNEVTIRYAFRKTTSSSWITGTTTITPTISDNKISFTGEIASDNPSNGWEIDSSYVIKVLVEDKLSIVEYEMILNAGIPTMSYDKNGVGIMCVFDSSKGGYLQVNGKTLEEIIREIIGGS